MKHFKTIPIPHLYIDIHFDDLSKMKGVDIKGSGFTCIMGDDSVVVFLQDIKNNIKNPVFFPVIAHEVMHVIQILCERNMMKVENEQEHTAYLMLYILNELLGYEGFKFKK